ncbi:MAG: tRNA (adenosine(37)-N6)-threonylcarbamoyltransferase complex ATPase subunit type 1 TsaE [Alphaproteobacteria bacterium]|nr:tRNA (adenosine(37)-N6)-threonylcarbamoyltransferase complex ATPase subunit type 1 TsaE [Alphaproteobacteria bacterium]MCK5556520.1 tRNA (adenosine(37)-N6)-threonylcarbamoyltransferase complex ATPase subunit type 1 TsaE [Alphaproteobacteria bacterium]
MTYKTLLIDNENALKTLAARFTPLLKTGDVVTLSGSLGVGKTAFARTLIHTLSPATGEVPSPTFTLVQVYDLPELSIWHFDLYRLEKKEMDVLELGWDEARRSGVSLVEWPDRLGNLLPKDRLEIKFDFVEDSENSRQITFTPFGTWCERLEEMK